MNKDLFKTILCSLIFSFVIADPPNWDSDGNYVRLFKNGIDYNIWRSL